MMNNTTAKTGLLLVVAALALGGLAFVGAAATTEMANETVTFDNDSNVTVDVQWNETLTDEANESASVTFYNASEYETDSANATVILSDEIAAEAGNLTSATYSESDGLVDGTDYQVVVEADDTQADSVTIDAGGLIGGGGALEGSSGVMIGVAALLGLGYVASRRD